MEAKKGQNFRQEGRVCILHARVVNADDEFTFIHDTRDPNGRFDYLQEIKKAETGTTPGFCAPYGPNVFCLRLR